MNNLILAAWEMLLSFTSLKKFNFIPSCIGMLWLFMILFYQMTFTYVYIFKAKDALLEWLANFAHKTYFTEAFVALGLIFVLHIFLTPIVEGGLVEMIHRYRRSNGTEKTKSLQGFFFGLRHYLPLFEVQNLIAIFKPLSVITFYILLLRLFGKDYLIPISITMGIYLFFAFFMNMCFAYAKFFIIFEHKYAFQALAASTSMAVTHISVTMKLYYTMILLYLRTIIVALFFLGIPFIISGIITFFTVLSVKLVLLLIFGIITLIFFIFITHLNSTLEIFVEATWYEAYMINKQEDIAEAEHHHTGHSEDTHKHESSGHSNIVHS